MNTRGDNDAVAMHETDCKEDQSDNDVIFVRHTHGKTGNTGDIKVVDDDGMWDEDVIFVRHTRGKTSRNLPATTSMKHSRKIPTGQSVTVEKKHKARHFDDSQYDMSSPDTDSSDQSLPSQKVSKRHRFRKKNHTSRGTSAAHHSARNGLPSRSRRGSKRVSGHMKNSWLTTPTVCQPMNTGSATGPTVKAHGIPWARKTEKVDRNSATNSSSRGSRMRTHVLSSHCKTAHGGTELSGRSKKTNKLLRTGSTSRPKVNADHSCTGSGTGPTVTAGDSQLADRTEKVDGKSATNSSSRMSTDVLSSCCKTACGGTGDIELPGHSENTNTSRPSVNAMQKCKWINHPWLCEAFDIEMDRRRQVNIGKHSVTTTIPPTGDHSCETGKNVSHSISDTTDIKQGCSCNGIPGRQLCPPCAVELDKCKTKSVSKHPATTPKPAEDNRSVRSTWPPVAVKQESTCGDGTGLWPHNTAELSNHKLDYVNQKCVTVSKLTGDELPNEATWPTAIVKQDPSKCPSTVTATSGENSSSEPSQLPKHPNEATWTSAIVRQESSKCPTAMTGENRSGGASQLASRVKQEGSHSTPAEEPLSSYPKTYTDDGAYNSKRTFDYTASSTSDTSIVLSKKQRLAPSTCQPLSSTLGLSHLDTPSHHGLCYGCGTLVPIPDLSQCPKAHWGCSQCLQKQAKSLLTKQSKGSLKCLCPECECVYSLSELHKVLPPIVVEMLEEKLTVKSLESTTNLGDKPKLGKVSRRQIHDKTKVDALTLPQSWEPMDINGEMKIVDILPDSDRYQNLLVKFHKTLHAPMACITRIRRVQNPVLWKFYSVKRKQMLHENGAVDLREYYLFHGTSKRVISAICKNNFDCRLCGMNGTTYGQGSYFAVDARYAHKFTDGGDPMRRAWLWSKMQTSQHPTQTVGRQASPMLTQIRQQLAHARQQLTHASLQPTQTSQQPTHASLQPTQTSQPQTQANQRPQSILPNNLRLLFDTPKRDTVRTRHTMFVARVLVGKYALGSRDFRKPPPLDASKPYEKCFDSCVNNTNNPHIYVVFDNAQCYPEYVIDYTME